MRLHIMALAATLIAPACASTSAAYPDVYPAAPTLPHTQADVDFMSGMIPHHAQAVLIGGWAAERTARQDVRVLAQRIVVGQQDEIALMQDWLRARGAAVPAADATHATMMMDGVAHQMLMPGMLTDAELAQLQGARGTEFDRLFLNFMIRHHQGAITMVDRLFSSQGAAQDETVFRFASDVYADQTTEIDRMITMLESLPDSSSKVRP